MTWSFLSLLVTVLFGALLIRYASDWGLNDIPGERKVHTVPTPRTGGIAMVSGSLVVWFVYAFAKGPIALSIPLPTLLAGIGFVGMGAMDDRFAFHPRQKFLWFTCFSFLAALPWVLNTSHPGYPIHFGRTVLQMPKLLAYPILALWFMSVPNAVNIEDAINGYMGGFTFILLAAFSILGVNTQIPVGALLGFLLLNWPKAKHFMGDAGSFGCGFLIAEAALRAGGSTHPLHLLVITAPISIDVAIGLIRRMRLGMSFFAADQGTLPHHVLRLCEGNHGLASLFLWTNAAVILFLVRHPLLEAFYLTAFIIFIVWLNRVPLFKPACKPLT